VVVDGQSRVALGDFGMVAAYQSLGEDDGFGLHLDCLVHVVPFDVHGAEAFHALSYFGVHGAVDLHRHGQGM